MLLDGSRSHDTVVLVDLGANGHTGLHRLKSWRAALDAVKHEPRPTASRSISELIDRLVTLSKGPYNAAMTAALALFDHLLAPS